MGDKSGAGGVSAPSPEYKPKDIVIFVGNSRDAMEDAVNIHALESDLQHACFHRAKDERLQDFRVRIYQWRKELGTHGAQEEINRHIDRADLAVFVFRIKSGQITRDEIERCRQRKIEILAFFPKPDAVRFNSDDDALTFADTVGYKRSLGSGKGWKAPEPNALTLPEPYSSTEDLLSRVEAWLVDQIETIALRRLKEIEKSGTGGEEARAEHTIRTSAGPEDIAPPAPPAFHYVRKPYVQRQKFAGRATELGLIDAWATAPEALLLFQAIGGMGKSALTWHWLKNHAANVRADWAGQLWYSFYESGADLNDFCVHALAYIRHQPPSTFRGRRTADLGDELRRELDAKPFLMILDGLERVLVAYNRAGKEHMTDEEAEVARDGMGLEREPRSCFRPEDDDVLAMLAQAKHGKLLASSRLTPSALTNAAQQPIPGVRHVALEGLEPADAEQMLRDAGVRGDGWKMRHFLADKFDCHPLSVGVVAGLVMRFMDARGDFDRWLESPKGGADLALVDKQLRGRQNHILSRAFDDLDDDEKALLGAIALANIELTPDVLRIVNPKRPIEPEKIEPPVMWSEWQLYISTNNAEIDAAYANLRETASAEERAAAQKKLDYHREKNFAEREVQYRKEYEEYSKMHAVWQQQAAAADDRLEKTLPDLESRGLLQYDTAAGSLDMHPAIRHTVLLGLNPDARSRTGSHVSDALSSRPVKPFEDARTLDDLALIITRVEALNAAGKLAAGWQLYHSGLDEVLFRMHYAHERLELLQPYFPKGWEQGPLALPKAHQAEALEDAAIALSHGGRSKAATVLYIQAIRVSLEEDELVADTLGNLANSLRIVGQRARAERLWAIAFRLAEAQGDDDRGLWLAANQAEQFIVRNQLDKADEALAPLREAISNEKTTPEREAHILFVDLALGLRQGRLEDAASRASLERTRVSGYRITEQHALNTISLWHQANGRHQQALEVYGDLIALANDIGSPFLPTFESRRAISLAAIGRKDEARRIAAKVDTGKEPPDVALALLYLDLGDREKARQHALAGYRRAWGEGPPYHDHWDLEDCRKVLAAVGEPEPQLPPFDPSKVEPFDFEPAVERLIEKLLAKRAASEAEEAKRKAVKEAAAPSSAVTASDEALSTSAAAGAPAQDAPPAAEQWLVAPAELEGAAFVETYRDTHIWLLADGRHYIDGTIAVTTLDHARATIDELAKPKH